MEMELEDLHSSTPPSPPDHSPGPFLRPSDPHLGLESSLLSHHLICSILARQRPNSSLLIRLTSNLPARPTCHPITPASELFFFFSLSQLLFSFMGAT